MPSPFPGMDPFLEDQAHWPAFHRRLTEALRERLSASLSGRYRVHAGTRRYTSDGEERKEDHLEVRQHSDGSLITLLEVVSPANKTTDAGRTAYLDQRRKAREAGASLVEIDLVLQGQPTLEYSREGLPHWDYAVTVTRSTHPDRYEIYTATLEKQLPRFRLPLAADDRDTVLNLQDAFTSCHTAVGYSRWIDYSRDPAATLGEEQRRWVDARLREKSVRPPVLLYEEVALLAYQMWLQEGCPHGRDQEHWHKAEHWLRSRQEIGAQGRALASAGAAARGPAAPREGV